MDELEIHPAAEIFPTLGGHDFDELCEDIETNGLLEPIELDQQGRILDGRNRYWACLETGTEPRTVEADLGGMGPFEYVIAKNLHRRHLTDEERAQAALSALPQLQAEAKARQETQGTRGAEGGRGNKKSLGAKSTQAISRAPTSTQRAAEMFGVSDYQVRKAKNRQEGKTSQTRQPAKFSSQIGRLERLLSDIAGTFTPDEAGQLVAVIERFLAEIRAGISAL